ncbi:hypothetical protein [Tahibacter caeni]|uniref:hypothetical protein n=1 Tax=Tahibacter caeni TaxID=1453545 RepID=UPI002147851B|nr:hypothetical protein [Tahibacter caeni]
MSGSERTLAATITLSGRAGQWRVSDYGEVAPVEIWALETLLHVQYERLDWILQ